MSALANDLTAHPGINKVRKSGLSEKRASHAGLNELQLPQDGLKLILQHI
jgi:hypothetical protein